MKDLEVQAREVNRFPWNLIVDNVLLLLTRNLFRAQKEEEEDLSTLTNGERAKRLHLSDMVEKVPRVLLVLYKIDPLLLLPLLDTFEKLRSLLLAKQDRFPIYHILTPPRQTQTLSRLPRVPTLD